MTEQRRPLSTLLGYAAGLVALWVAIGLFNTSEFYRRGSATYRPTDWDHVLYYQLTSALVWAFWTPFLVYLAERLAIRRPHRVRNAAILLFLLPFLAWFRAAFGAVVMRLGEGSAQSWDFISLSVAIRIHRNAFIILVIIGVVNLVLTYREAVAGEQAEFALQARLANAELAHLRQRLQPRFMFNALHEIGRRIRTQPAEADALLVRVSRLLRRSLYFDRRGVVTLRDELDFLDQYLEVERIRLGNRLTTRIDVEDEILGALVPPLLLQTLVASAVLQSPEGGSIGIGGYRHDGLRLEVRSSRGAGSVSDDTVTETRLRLRQLFGKHEAITVSREAHVDAIALTLPLRFEESP